MKTTLKTLFTAAILRPMVYFQLCSLRINLDGMLQARVQVTDPATRHAMSKAIYVAHHVGRMHDLALQVGKVDGVVIGNRERADACGCEVHRRGRAQAAGTDDQRTRIKQGLLAVDVDLGQQDVAAVAQQLLVVHRAPTCTRAVQAACRRGRRECGDPRPGHRPRWTA